MGNTYHDKRDKTRGYQQAPQGPDHHQQWLPATIRTT